MVKRPPASIEEWLEQVAADPSIPLEFKNGAEDQIKLTSTSFSSGSMVKATESLRMRVIHHKSRRAEDLTSMMTDDPENGYTGYVSSENMSEARRIFNSKRHLLQGYLDEVRLRDEKWHAARKKTRPGTSMAETLQSDTIVPPEPQLAPHRPSEECGNFRIVLYWQLQGITKVKPGYPTDDELERTSCISKPGPEQEPPAPPTPAAVNRLVTPLKPRIQTQTVQDTPKDGFHSTPELKSYWPARGGKANKPAPDESFINTAILLLLQTLTLDVGMDLDRLDWMATRLAFHLVEKVVTENTDTGEVEELVRNLMEARVDGYLCRKSSPFEEALNEIPLAIIEAKPYTRSSADTAIRRQEGAEMACWISQSDGADTGLLISSSGGRKRRLLISQDRHEIYIIVGEYGAGFEEHIRPSTSIVQGSAVSQAQPGKPGSSSAGSNSTEVRRDPSLLAGSPSYIKRMESKSIIVETGKKTAKGQPTRPESQNIESPRIEGRWEPDPGDFLIMNEFGPFLTTDSSHMNMLFRRLIALMLELRGP